MLTLTTLLCCLSLLTPADDLLTVAETSNYTKTATHAEVVDLIGRIDAQSDIMHRTSMGTSVEGRDLPLMVIANPPVTTPAEARASGKLIVFCFGNIHAGEVCGKEALLMLARETALERDHPLLNDIVLLVAPIYNADGNDRMAPDNRRGQKGPTEMGQRPNAQGLDLNRDHIKLESPEARAMAKLLTEWDPHLTIDTHTTNGSYHRYTLTYAAPQNPAGYGPSIEFIRDELLPRVSGRLLERTGYDSFFYGNFSRDMTTWSTYSASPIFGAPYRGLRGQMAVLSEAYSYAPYRDRVLGTLEFVREILIYADEHAETMRTLHQEARDATSAAGRNPQPDDLIGLRYRLAAFPEPVMIKGYEMLRDEDGWPQTGADRDYSVVHRGRFESTLSVARPFAYIVPGELTAVIDTLHAHGVETSPFRGDVIAEVATVTEIAHAPREFQGHRQVRLETTTAIAPRLFDDAVLVRTAQPLGSLIVYLLEAQAQDGLASWNFVDDHLAEGRPYPIVRIGRERDLSAADSSD